MRQKPEAGKRTNKGGTFSGKSGLRGGIPISEPTTFWGGPPTGGLRGYITNKSATYYLTRPWPLTARRI